MISDLDSIHVGWKWHRDTFLRAQREMWRLRARKKNTRAWLFRCLMGIAGIYLGYALFRSIAGALGFAVFVGAMGVVGGMIGQRVQWRVQATSFEKRCMPKYASVTYVIDSTGFRITNADTDLHLGWSGFQRWAESDEFFLLFTGPSMGYYIPKQAVTSGDLQRTRERLSSSILMTT